MFDIATLLSCALHTASFISGKLRFILSRPIYTRAVCGLNDTYIYIYVRLGFYCMY